jgi:hypothetical protein
MILDNVDDEDTFSTNDVGKDPLIEYIPQSSNGTVILTSRSTTIARNLTGDNDRSLMHVGQMKADDALKLLQTRLTVDNQCLEDAKTLVRSLDYIPLAITQAASFIHMRHPGVCISNYLGWLEDYETSVQLPYKGNIQDPRRD